MKFVLLSEPAQKCENNAIFKQNKDLELFISLKMAISCYFYLRGNLDFPDFLQIKFYNINYWIEIGSWLITDIKIAVQLVCSTRRIKPYRVGNFCYMFDRQCLWAVWPDGLITFSIFGHLQHWNFAQYQKYVQNFAKYLIDPLQFAKAV